MTFIIVCILGLMLLCHVFKSVNGLVFFTLAVYFRNRFVYGDELNNEVLHYSFYSAVQTLPPLSEGFFEKVQVVKMPAPACQGAVNHLGGQRRKEKRRVTSHWCLIN